uniref:Tudor domain-containing protein n=1 Tax=Strongyloides venezuelensis TaxID=75913 RepID=A0A0K0FRN6_STRVS
MNPYTRFKKLYELQMLNDPNVIKCQIFLIDPEYFSNWMMKDITYENVMEHVIKDMTEQLGYSIFKQSLQERNLLKTSATPISLEKMRSNVSTSTPISSTIDEISKNRSITVSNEQSYNKTFLMDTECSTASQPKNQSRFEFIEISKKDDLLLIKNIKNYGSIVVFDHNSTYGYIHSVYISNNEIKVTRKKMSNNTKVYLTQTSAVLSFFKKYLSLVDTTNINDINVFIEDKDLANLLNDIGKGSLVSIPNPSATVINNFNCIQEICSKFKKINICLVKQIGVCKLLDITKQEVEAMKIEMDKKTINTNEQSMLLNKTLEPY